MSQERASLTLCVIICTYRRPDVLARCLDGLAAQSRLPDDVILVVRPTDHATHAVLAARPTDALPWRVVPVDRAGLIAARNAGLAACASDIVAFCDDDTVAGPDWISGIAAHFVADPRLGGLGGRDRCHDGTGFDDRRRRMVGRVQWFGRPVGNHHLGYGAARPVHFLKGANMSYRLRATRGLRFDERLRGAGAQPHDDLAFSLAVHRAGWRLVYDPAVALTHHVASAEAPRTYVASTGLPDAAGFYDCCFNLALTLEDHLHGVRRLACRAWILLIGMRVCPGLLQVARMLPAEGAVAWQKYHLAQRAVTDAVAFRGAPAAQIARASSSAV